MAIQTNDILKVVASLVFADDVIMQNVFHLVIDQINGTGADTEIGQDMEGYIEAIWNEMVDQINENVESTSLTVYVYDSADDDFDEVALELWDLSTTETAQMVPHGVAAVQSYTTTEPDVRGKKFWGGFTETSKQASTLVAAAITDVAAAGVQVILEYTDGVSGNVYTPGVWSPTRSAFFAYGGTVITNAILGYQRRRKPGVGI